MSKHFKFIEIGSNHVDTLIHEYGLNVNGLLVEPIKESFDLIPTSNTIIKENCAITDYNGTIDMYIHFDKEDIKKWKFVSRENLKAGDCKGSDVCSIYSNKHVRPTSQKRKVNCKTFLSLIEKYSISEVEVLKIDTEGHDHIILKQVYDCMKSGQFKINKMLRYEKNRLSSHNELKRISDQIKALGEFKKERYVKKQAEVFLIK